MARISAFIFLVGVALLGAGLVGFAEGATFAELRLARQAVMNQQFSTTYGARLFARIFSAGNASVHTQGKITILIPGNFGMQMYKYQNLTWGQRSNIFNYHILYGALTYTQLQQARDRFPMVTRLAGFKLFKMNQGINVYFQALGKAAGPRNAFESQTPISIPNLFVGTDVVVHGVSNVVTPPFFVGGPYWKPPF